MKQVRGYKSGAHPQQDRSREAMRVCAFSAVCEEDGCWLPQYLAEVERLGINFVMHLDRCAPRTRALVKQHPQCSGTTENNDQRREFTEQHKQGVFDLVVRGGFDWALAWDVDETFERNAPQKISQIMTLNDAWVYVRWVNLWGDERHVRVDGALASGGRVKFYNLRGYHWRFLNPIVNGAYSVNPSGSRKNVGGTSHDLVCIHWGFMTKELRDSHKTRWDRIYGRAVGRNPYGMWNFVTDETIVPKVVTHDYF